MLEWLSLPAAWVGLFTLTALEIVLGIDNVVFISILTNTLPPEERKSGMKKGLLLAVLPRVLLLLTIGIVMRLNTPWLTLPFPEPDPELLKKGQLQLGLSGQDLVFIVGGLFLIYKSVKEIHHKLEGHDESKPDSKKGAVKFSQLVGMILLINVIFSLDSVITAVGMVEPAKVGGPSSAVFIMILSVVISTIVMLWFATPVAHFVEKHPTVKMLALSFLILIGVNLIAEGFHQHVPKGYTYFAIAFSFAVEVLNLRLRHPAEHPTPPPA